MQRADMPDRPRVLDPAAGADPAFRESVVDLLGALAYAELTGFTQLVGDSQSAPDPGQKAQVCAIAVREFHHHEMLVARLRELGADPQAAMQPFVRSIDAFHDRTRPSTWLEGLVKVYVGEGIAQDFYREVSAYVDADTREVVARSLEDSGQAEFAVRAVRAAVEDDERVGGRLALWGRRLVGEALSQAQQVAVERDGLTALLVGGVGGPGADLAEVGRMFTRLTEAHSRRMADLGLNA